MPTLKSLKESTEKVVIERGPVRIEFDCYLERISANNDEYEALLRQGRILRGKESMLELQVQLHLDNDWISGELVILARAKAEAVEPSEAEGVADLPDLPNDAAVTSARKEIEKRMEKLGKEHRAAIDEQMRNRAARIAYLCAGWDVTDEAGKPVDITPTVLLENLSGTLIIHILSTIEESVFGPLGQKPPTTS